MISKSYDQDDIKMYKVERGYLKKQKKIIVHQLREMLCTHDLTGKDNVVHTRNKEYI